MSRNINDLHPRLQSAIEKIKAQFPELGVGECFRSATEQDELYAQGRTKPGNIVTNARGSSYSSQHQWGIAFDFFYNVKGKEYSDTAWFKRVADYAKSIGLAWGGDWSSFKDMPHLYLPDWGSTTSELKTQYGTFEKFKKTWETENASTGSSAAQSAGLSVDGIWGEKTTRRLQQIFGTTQDGIVSHQFAVYKKDNPGLAGGWQWETKPSSGSPLIRAIQAKVGVSVDGHIGPQTIRAMQKWLGTPQDGKVSKPSSMVKALQKWCNKH